ncbi:hypothetical protein L6V77_28225, partial [Myxococcota bacterium]|nr:hypothetical protein [Myxococcota bacterium]
DGGAGGAGGAPAPDTTRVTHFPEDCGTLVSLIPAPGEAGQFGLSRITPPSWPFTATAIEYEMFNGLRGDGTTNTVDADQRVLVFKGTDVVPDAVPDLLQESIVPAVAGYEASLYTVVLPLDGAVTLTEGEHLFVAIDFPVDGVDLHSAIAACQQGPGGSPQPFPADRYYWGAALEAPFPWTPLHDFGLDLWLQMSMWGHAGE